MTFFTTVLFSVLLVAGASADEVGNQSSPAFTLEYFDRIGRMHTEAFEALGELYTTKRPRHRSVMLDDVRDIVASFCDDDACRSALERRRRDEEHDDDVIVASGWPVDLDPATRRSIDETFSALELLVPDYHDEDGRPDHAANLDLVVGLLQNVRRDAAERHNDPNASPTAVAHSAAVISGASVAIESARLWTSVYNDGHHPLFGLHHTSYYPESTATTMTEERGDGRPVLRRALDENRNEEDTHVLLESVVSRDLWHYYHHDHHQGSGSGSGSNVDDFDFSEFTLDVNIFEGTDCFDFLDFLSADGGDGTTTDDDKTDCFTFLSSRFDPVGAVSADVNGAIIGFLEELVTNPLGVLDPTGLLFFTVAKAVSLSARWMLYPPSAVPSTSPTTPMPTTSLNPTKAPTAAPSTAPTTAP